MRGVLYFLLLAGCVRGEERVQISSTPNGVRFGWLGDKPVRPAPTVLFLGGPVESAFNQPHFREGIDALREGVWCVSLDLPGHGKDVRAGEPGGIASWRHRLEKGEDFVAYFVGRATAVLDYLIHENLADPGKIGVFGTSRGGFMALHLAAADSRVRRVAAFAPLTDLAVLSEFATTPAQAKTRTLRTSNLADRLHDCAIWMIIGSTDYRVSTGSMIEFGQRVIEAAEARGVRPRIEFHVEPSEGHRVPPLSYARAGAWMRRSWDAQN